MAEEPGTVRRPELRRLLLWRHAETDYNSDGRMQGHLDSELSRCGWQQARTAVPLLARFAPELVITSDLRRASDTAAVFTEAVGAPLRVDTRLRETHIGRWQGRSGDEVDREWPGQRQRWRGDASFAPPGGESRLAVSERASDLVAELERDQYATVLLATHGGLIVALTARLLGLPVGHWTVLAGIGNCRWVELDRTGEGWRLRAYNAGAS